MSLFSIFRRNKPQDAPLSQSVIIVSGLPRSGTSMMMKTLAAGGLLPVTDNLRTADESNPKGYYEFERVKKLKDGDYEWLEGAQGKVVKVISALLEFLPANYRYKIIFMQRNIDEVLASQREMLIRRGEATDKVSDEKMAELYHKHLNKIQAWLSEQKNMQVLYISYNGILADPQNELKRVNAFLNNSLNLPEMLTVVDRNLYRQRQ